MKQNITVSLEKELIRKARVIAARRSTSVSGLLSQELKRMVESTERYQQARLRALSNLQTGFHLGGRPTVSREELHDREGLR